LYDQNGDRIKIKKYDSANTTIYTPFKEFMMIKNNSGTFNYTYIYQDDVLVARKNPDGTTQYYHDDQLGSTSIITNQTGGIIETTSYSPYGEVLSGGTQERKLYTGQYADNIDQYYYGARYYKPSIAQFEQADTEIQDQYDPQYLNRYTYVRNDPYKLTDPDGRNARVYFDGNVNFGMGHTVVGVDNPNQPGYELRFENGGLGRDQILNIAGLKVSSNNDLARDVVSFVTDSYPAKTYVITQQYRDADGNIMLPNGYTDYYEIEQDETMDSLMIKKGWELNSKKWGYNAATHSSLQYTNEILKAGDQGLNGMGLPVPVIVFYQNKKAVVNKDNAKQIGYDMNTKSGCSATKNNRGGYDYKC